jgi:AAA domain (dynein-related subfamily)
MPRASWVSDDFYRTAERIRDDCLVADGSLFTPGRPIWTAEAAAEWSAAINAEDTSDRTFSEKLRDQLAGLGDAAIQFAAECLYVAVMTEADTGGDKKREHVANALSILEAAVALPDDLAAVLDTGLATYGQGGRNRRDAHLRYLALFVVDLKRRSPEERRSLLTERDALRAFARSIDIKSATMQREALLHLLLPDSFEPTVSVPAKRKIAAAFAEYVDDPSADVDSKLASIRSALAADYPDGLSFWEPEQRAVWDPSGPPGRRAWLVRGASAYDTNLIPSWLEHGFVSMSSVEGGEVRPGTPFAEVVELFEKTIGGPRGKVRNAAVVTRRFVDGMATGDLVLTIDPEDRIYVGRVTGDVEWDPDAEPGKARRRPVEWLNAAHPATRDDLSPDARRLLRPNTVIEMTAVADEIAKLAGIEQPGAWEPFLEWAAKLYAHPSFDEQERDYKLEVARRLAHVRARLGEDDWIPALRRALGPPNNLTHYRANLAFLAWCESDPEAAARLLRSLWDGDPDAVLRGNASDFPAAVFRGRGGRLNVLSLLLLARDPLGFPVFRQTPYERICALLGRDVVDRSADSAALYADFVALLDEIVSRLAARGIHLRDRLDAQGVAWWIASNDPPEDWPEDERRAFLAWHDGETPSPSPPPIASGAMVPQVPAELADRLNLPPGWLNQIVDLLNSRKQVVFYGPPGTGKTLVAQRLGEHVAAAGGSYELVQFHPSYGYEDFFEGFRPRLSDDKNSVVYDLRPGPLRLAAKRARERPDVPHLLVVDEINRGNVAKIFGELFFLLEYRDRGIPLQYSPEERFELPGNLFFLGTMNTADRSIALVDTALRRRFYFVPFLPTEEPVKSVLRKWLRRERLDEEPALLLERLNEAIGAGEFAIGPSYFIAGRNGSTIDLERVWRFAIGPLLDEHFYGTGRDIDAEFGWDALRAKGGSAEASPDDEA